MSDIHPLTFEYRNYRGETLIRHVTLPRVTFGASKWHPKRQWFLIAHDLDRGEERWFAMCDIIRILGPDSLANKVDELSKRPVR